MSKTLNRSELIEAISADTEESKAVINRVMDSFMRQVQETVAAGGGVKLTGFGKFERTDVSQRKGRNPNSGETIVLPATKRPRFTPGAGFKDAVREAEMK